MARKFSDGAELGAGVSYFWDYDGGYTSVTAEAARSGSYGYKSDTWGQGLLVFKKLFSDLSELYYRMAYSNNHGITATAFLFYYDASAIIAFNFNSLTNKYDLYVNGVYQASTINMITIGVWHLWEFRIKIADSPNGIVQVKVDGFLEIDWSGDTLFTYGAINGVGITARCYVDDIALNDTTGLTDNSWCGDEHYEVLMPNGDTATIQWTGSDGDKVNNHDLVDERPPSVADYVYSNTPTEQDIYDVDDFTATGKIVTRIWSEGIAVDANATSQQIKIGFKTGGSVYLSGAKTLSSNYKMIKGDDTPVNPADSGVWEDADLDAIQFVVERE